MCFSPKVKTPKVDTNQVRAIDPAPLSEEPKGVLFGGEDEADAPKDGISSEVPTGGKKSLKVKLDDTESAKLKDDKAKKQTGTKASIRKSVFNSK